MRNPNNEIDDQSVAALGNLYRHIFHRSVPTLPHPLRQSGALPHPL